MATEILPLPRRSLHAAVFLVMLSLVWALPLICQRAVTMQGSQISTSFVLSDLVCILRLDDLKRNGFLVRGFEDGKAVGANRHLLDQASAHPEGAARQQCGQELMRCHSSYYQAAKYCVERRPRLPFSCSKIVGMAQSSQSCPSLQDFFLPPTSSIIPINYQILGFKGIHAS